MDRSWQSNHLAGPFTRFILSEVISVSGIISQCDKSNVVDRNEIFREKTKEKLAVLPQEVVKNYNNNQFKLYFDRRKDSTISLKINEKKVIIKKNLVPSARATYL